MDQNTSKTQPPKLATNFLRWFCRTDFIEDVEGDLTEFFEHNVDQYGPGKAKRIYLKEVLLLFRPKMIKRRKIDYLILVYFSKTTSR